MDCEETEEQLVLIELAGIIDSDFLYKISDKNCKILGIDTQRPVIQIGHNVFSGEYKNAAGALAIFEEKDGNHRKGQKELELKHVMNKKLVMKRAFLNEKSTSPSSRKPEDCKMDASGSSEEQQSN